MIAIDAIVFDLDGTLIDSRRDLAGSIRTLQKHYRARQNSLSEVTGFIGDGVVKLVQRALPELPASRLEEAVAAFKTFYRKHCLEHTRLYPGVRKTLKHFQAKKLAVVTNKPVRISGFILQELGLDSYFSVLIGGDSLPHKKPHPEPVLNVLKTLGLKNPRRVVMVGDGENDVQAGKEAGTLTCGLKSNIGDHQKLLKSRPDFMLSDISKLMRIFS